MKSFFCMLIFAGMLAAYLPVSAEYYQYMDNEGNLRFTDDVSQVPESCRDSVKEYDSVKAAAGEPGSSDQRKISGQRGGIVSPDPGTWDGALKRNAEQLERESNRLQQTCENLKQEKQALEKKARGGMDAARQAAYDEKIRQLNARIKQYHKKRQAYLKKRRQFESQFHSGDNMQKNIEE